ncbi:hypothetical protein BLNAU_11602 [Blattamonas nauphoetae]|uniref:Uncharacterized protein n=1 Tax=Blattamonas nauphoetae TaxID=2049346 RepID=A0ABQ9XM31_9EUKA|nr:hypothetical protein BLNAU_11602 [Blattamonas nauphoetae]
MEQAKADKVMTKLDKVLLLQTLVGRWNISELQTAGFEINKNHFKQPQRYRKSGGYTPLLNHSPPIRQKYASDDMILLFRWLSENTNERCESQQSQLRPSYEQCLTAFGPDPPCQTPSFAPIYNPNSARQWIWEKRVISTTKADLFRKLTRDHPNSIFTVRAFYKVVKNISRAKKRTDICVKCDRLLYLVNRKTQHETQGKPFTIELQEEIDVLLLHQKHASVQLSTIENDTTNLNPNHIVCFMNFKENWRLIIQNTQSSKEFFTFQQITHLGVGVKFKMDN